MGNIALLGGNGEDSLAIDKICFSCRIVGLLKLIMKNIEREIIEKYVLGKEEKLIQSFIEDGPTAVKIMLGVSEFQWQVIFDYLTFNHDLLRKCFEVCAEFFTDLYVRYGKKHVRAVLDLQDKKYDDVFNEAFDYSLVDCEGLYMHVLHGREKYLLALKARGSEYLRNLLTVSAEKYNSLWEQILDLLLNAQCEAIMSEAAYERGIKGFCMMMNRNREHRPLSKMKLYLN